MMTTLGGSAFCSSRLAPESSMTFMWRVREVEKKGDGGCRVIGGNQSKPFRITEQVSHLSHRLAFDALVLLVTVITVFSK